MEEIINSVMQSPENTNPNVLRGQLQNMGGGSGGGAVYATFTDNKGWSCDKTYAELKAAYDAGKVIVAIDGTQNGSAIGVMKYMEQDGVGGLVTAWVVSSVSSPKSASASGVSHASVAAGTSLPKTIQPGSMGRINISRYALVDGMGAFVEKISGNFQTN